MSRAELTDLIHGILRRTFGNDLADQLGIPVSAASPFLALTTSANKQARRWQTFSPESTAQAIQDNTVAREAAGRSAGTPGGPVYQQHVQNGTVGS